MLIETINQEFKAGTKYQVLPNFRICCWELVGLKITNFCACLRSFCAVCQATTIDNRVLDVLWFFC